METYFTIRDIAAAIGVEPTRVRRLFENQNVEPAVAIAQFRGYTNEILEMARRYFSAKANTRQARTRRLEYLTQDVLRDPKGSDEGKREIRSRCVRVRMLIEMILMDYNECEFHRFKKGETYFVNPAFCEMWLDAEVAELAVAKPAATPKPGFPS